MPDATTPETGTHAALPASSPEPPAPGTTSPPATPATASESNRLPDDHPLVKAYADAKAKLKKREDAELSEAERLTADLASHAARGDKAEARVALLEAAMEHGLSMDDLALLGDGPAEDIRQRAAALAKRLAGSEAERKRAGNHVGREGTNPPASSSSDDGQFARSLLAGG